MRYISLFISYFLLICLLFSCLREEVNPKGDNNISVVLPNDSLINISADSLPYQINVLSSLDWEISEKPDWVSFETLKFKGATKEMVVDFSVLENTFSKTRKDVIILTNTAKNKAQIEISQLAKNTETDSTDFIFRIEIIEMPDTVDYSGNTYEVLVTCNRDWWIENTLSWVIFEDTVFNGSDTIRRVPFKVLMNQMSTTREDTVFFRSGNKTIPLKILQLSQADVEDPNLVFEVEVVGMPDTVDYGGNSYQLLVTCNRNWRIENALSWVSFEHTVFNSSEVAQKVDFTVFINQDSTIREGTILLKSGRKTIPFFIKQYKPLIEPLVHSILFDNSIISARASEFPNRKVTLNTMNGGTFRLAVDKDCDWVQIHYRHPGQFFNIFFNDVSLSFKDNLLPKKRSTHLYLMLFQDTVATYILHQKADANYLEINVPNHTINAPTREEIYNFEVQSSSDFNIQGNPAWISIQKGTTTNRITPIKVIVQKNNSGARMGNFAIVSKDGSRKLVITVNQKAAFIQEYPITNFEYGIIVKATISDDVPERFEGQNQEYRNFANKLTLRIPSDQQAMFWTNEEYGFVDPNNWKKLVSPLMTSVYNGDPNKDYPGRIYFPSYDGRAGTIRDIRISVSYSDVPPLQFPLFEDHYYFFHVDLPIPPNLTVEDFLIYTIEIDDIIDGYKINPKITWKIVSK